MIVVDVETTGLDPTKHAIVSIGAVDFENPDNHFYGESRINDEVDVDIRALGVNGFTHAEITDKSKPSLAELAKEFNKWTENIPEKILSAFNAAFDEAMLRAAFNAAELRWPFGFKTVDLHAIAYAHMRRMGEKPPLNYGSSALTANTFHNYVGLPREPEPHHGLTGAKMEAESFSRLIYGKSLLEEYAKYPIPEKLNNNPQQKLL